MDEKTFNTIALMRSIEKRMYQIEKFRNTPTPEAQEYEALANNLARMSNMPRDY
jgi:hypothetical protein